MNKRHEIKTGIFFLTLSITIGSLFVTTEVIAACSLDDLQRCASCNELDKTVNLKQPDQGEYYRGAYWNGLYTAYVMNCQSVGKKLLDNNANPNLGGSFGAFLATVANEWPHKKQSINQQWSKLLQSYSIDTNWKNPYMDMSAKTVIDDGLLTVSYPAIWTAFIEKTNNRNISSYAADLMSRVV